MKIKRFVRARQRLVGASSWVYWLPVAGGPSDAKIRVILRFNGTIQVFAPPEHYGFHWIDYQVTVKDKRVIPITQRPMVELIDQGMERNLRGFLVKIH